MLGKATAKGFPSYPRRNAVFEALNIPIAVTSQTYHKGGLSLFSSFSSLVSGAGAS